MSSNHYFVDLYPIWKEKLSQAQGQVTFVTPYLTPLVADDLIRLIPPDRCTIFTSFELEDFASGSSSLRTIRKLVQAGYQLYKVDRLHSNIVMIHGQFATIGSQGLTQRGRTNVEASFLLTRPEELSQLESELTGLLAGKLRITFPLLESMAKVLPHNRSQMRQLKQQCHGDERNVRLEAIRLRFLQYKEQRANLTDQEKMIQAIQWTLSQYCTNGIVPLPAARHFIWHSARWTHHRGYNDVSARGQTKNIYGVDGKDWRLDYGGNIFFVARAIERCSEAMHDLLKGVQSGHLFSKSSFYDILEEQVSSSVGSFSNLENRDPYPMVGDYLQFGAHAIDVRKFVNEFLKLIPDNFFIPDPEQNDSFSK